MSGELGQLNGLPVSIIIRTTLQDLESRAGVGVTGGGTILPITDVIRLAAHANHYLAVFDEATGSALDLFRARPGGFPGAADHADRRAKGAAPNRAAPSAPTAAQVHHVVADWVDGGNTNVDELGLACGPDNRMVDQDGGWTTSINARGEVEWAPPPHLDTGQARVNHYHRPERLLHPPDEPEPAEEPERDTGEPPPPEPIRDSGCREPQPLDPVGDDDADQPGGPADEPDTGESLAPEPIGDGGCGEPEPFNPVARRGRPRSSADPPTTTTPANPQRPNRSRMAAAANRNRSTPWRTMATISSTTR